MATSALRKIVLLVSLLCLPLLASAHIPVSLAPMLSRVTPAVVNISVEKNLPKSKPNANTPPLDPTQPDYTAGVGSGVIFNAKKGLIITNAHVVDDERLMVVTLKDGRRYKAHLIAKDDDFDIAIIQIHAKHLHRIPFANSDTLHVGDFVAAIGSPFGLRQTVTSGLVSALNRSHPQIEGFQSFIQTDAPINPGNSGGALVNMAGQLVGINTAILAPSNGNIGIGFAIPSNMVKNVVRQLQQYGTVKRGMLGVSVQNITPAIAKAFHVNTQGALITGTLPGSPARKAGLKSEDIVKAINGEPIKSSTALRNNLALMRPGTHFTLNLVRNHKPITLTATVGDPNRFNLVIAVPLLSGLRLQNLDEVETDGTQLQGVIVFNADDTSAGAIAGLQAGDVITHANFQRVKTLSQLVALAKKNADHLLLEVSHDNKNEFLVVNHQDP